MGQKKHARREKRQKERQADRQASQMSFNTGDAIFLWSECKTSVFN